MLLHRYNTIWPVQFAALQQELLSRITGIVITIEHVGSTAIPGLAAKPIIDIDIIHEHESDFKSICTQLEAAGYFHNGDQGIPLREVFKRKGGARHTVLDAIPHHLYVCPRQSPALERHLLSRDFLRKHAWAREQYQQMKYALADKAGQDRKIYAALKEREVNEFIDRIIMEEHLARTTGENT